MLSQCKKKDLQYKMAAIEATGSVLHALKTDVFSEFFEIVLQNIKPVSLDGSLACVTVSLYTHTLHVMYVCSCVRAGSQDRN
jgi:hypothetical protein